MGTEAVSSIPDTIRPELMERVEKCGSLLEIIGVLSKEIVAMQEEIDALREALIRSVK